MSGRGKRKRQVEVEEDEMDEGQYEEDRPVKRARKAKKAWSIADYQRVRQELNIPAPTKENPMSEEDKKRIMSRLGGSRAAKKAAKKPRKKTAVGARKVAKKTKVYYKVNKEMPRKMRGLAAKRTTEELDENLGKANKIVDLVEYFQKTWGNNGEKDFKISQKAARLLKGKRDEAHAILNMAAAIAMTSGKTQVREIHVVCAIYCWNEVETYCSKGNGVLKLVVNDEFMVPEYVAKFPLFRRVARGTK